MTAFFESGDTGAVLGAKLRQDASFGKFRKKMERGGLHRPLCLVSAGNGDRRGAFLTGFTAVCQAGRCSRST